MLDAVTAVGRRVAETRGYELVDVELKRAGGGYVLRLYVDRPGGIGLDELQSVSEEVSAILDVEDPIDASYTLEVSSPGLDRPFTGDADWRRNVGRLVKVQTEEDVEGRRQWTGRLQSIEDGAAVLDLEKKKQQIRIPLDKVTVARLEVDWKR